MSDISDLFKDDKYCFSQISEARKIMTSGNTTSKQWDALYASLSFMYLYCSEKLECITLATINEATEREMSNLLISLK